MACKLIRVGHSWSFTRYVSISVETSSVTESFSEEEEGIYLNKSLTSDHFPKEAGKTFALAESSDAAAGLSRLHLYASCLRNCSNRKDLALGRTLHNLIITCGFGGNTLLSNLLLQLYGCCVAIEDAEASFSIMPRRNLLSFNYMLSGHVQNGDNIACCKIFQQMQLQGQLDELEVLLETMPFEASGTSWMTLLGACRTHLDVQRGANAAENVYAREPENAAPFLMLSSIQGSQPNHCKETADCK
eukprot:c9919_g1_i2 orf=190-924(-)